MWKGKELRVECWSNDAVGFKVVEGASDLQTVSGKGLSPAHQIETSSVDYNPVYLTFRPPPLPIPAGSL